ncbi:MAG: hypothetical protein WA101_00680 [Minisyncoccia bacterium]
MVEPFEIWKREISEEKIKDIKSSINKLEKVGKDSTPVKNIIGNSGTILEEIEKEVNAHNSTEALDSEETLLKENSIIGTNLDDQISKIQKLKKEGKKAEIEKLIENN